MQDAAQTSPSRAALSASESNTLNLYEILGFDTNQETRNISATDIRTAYKNALLRNHPDKRLTTKAKSTVTVDAISLAYGVLSNPVLRREYDETLLHTRFEDVPGKFKAFWTGIETVDLDELVFDGKDGTWTRTCRCGVGGGYVVCEEELEKHADDGELITGCKGCSLWIRILYSVA